MKYGALSLAILFCSSATAHAQDSDRDGAMDVSDAAPCDAAIAGWAFAPAEGATGTLLFEDQWPDLGDGDFNDLVLAYHYRVGLDAQGRAVRLEARFEALAIGGDFDNGLGLHLPVPRAAVREARVAVGDDPAAPVSPAALDDEVTLTVIRDLRRLHGGAAGPINVSGAASRGPAISVTLDLDPTPVDIGAAPFDVFLFRTLDPSHEVHRAGFPGTAAMDPTLFDTGSDASSTLRTFVDDRNLPFVLHLPDAVVYPAEGVAVEQVFPRILSFAASGGALDRDFYVGAVDAYPHALAAAAPPAIVPDPTCIPVSCRAARNAGATANGRYLVAPVAEAPFEVYCNMTAHGGGWTLYTSVLRSGASSPGTVTPGSARYMPSARIRALAAISTQVYLRTGSNPSRYVLSTPNTTPIHQLRNLRSLSRNPSGYVSSHWSGPMHGQMWYDCGHENAYPYVYWACNNTNGLHFSTGSARWIYLGAREDVEAWVR